MKKIDLVIWFLVGLALFLMWSRFVSTSRFTSDDEKWISKSVEYIKQNKTEEDIIGTLRLDAQYGYIYATKIYKEAQIRSKQ